jgi:hypothetical protein
MGRLPKADQYQTLAETLQEEIPGVMITVKQARKIFAKSLGHVSQKSYDNARETLEVLFDAIQVIPHKGLIIIPRQAPQDFSDDAATMVLEELAV